MKYVALLVALLSGVAVYAQPVPEGIHRPGSKQPNICGQTAVSIPALESFLAARLRSLPGNERYVAYEDAASWRVWTFTTPAHPAHPAVACRSVVERDGQIGTAMEIACHSTRENCDALYREFEALMARTIRAARESSREE